MTFGAHRTFPLFSYGFLKFVSFQLQLICHIQHCMSNCRDRVSYNLHTQVAIKSIFFLSMESLAGKSSESYCIALSYGIICKLNTNKIEDFYLHILEIGYTIHCQHILEII